MQKSIKFLKKKFFLLLLIFLSVLLRLYNIENLFYFTYDESIPAFVGKRLFLHNHIPLIGGVTPFGFHLGPYFYWFYAVLLNFYKFDPIVWGYAGAILSAATTYLIYKVGALIGSKKIALTSAVLWTFSLLVNIYDRHLWALYWGPLTSLLVIYTLIKIIKHNNRFIYLLGLTLGLSIHADPSNLIFVFLSIAVIKIYKVKLNIHYILSTALATLFLFPLLVFDIRHDFANTKPVLDFLNKGNNKPGLDKDKLVNNFLIFPQTTTRLIYKFGDKEISKDYSYCSNYIEEKHNSIPQAVLAAVTMFLIVTTVLCLKNRGNYWFIVALAFIFYFVGVQLYGTVFKADIFEHYLAGLFPVIVLFISRFLSFLPTKLYLLALAVFIAANLFKLSELENKMSLKNKKNAIEYVKSKTHDKNFSLDSLSTCWKWNGYRYLFSVFYKDPVKSYADPNLGYLYEVPISLNHPETVVSFVVHDFSPENINFYKSYSLLKSHEKESKFFGSMEVIILDNSSGWFK